jgi:transketolase
MEEYMALTIEEKKNIEVLCSQFRKTLVKTLFSKQTGHPGGSLSVCEILTILYFKVINVNPKDLNMRDRDRVVLCKGHAAPMLYLVLAEKGFFSREEIATLRDFNSHLQGHPCAAETPGVELSTGPLGIGLSASLGMAVGLKLDNSPARVYAVLGDGEINEGTVWEACMAATKYKADNLCAILDWNGVQLDGTNEDIMPLGDVHAKFESFGWHCLECDGHDVAALSAAFDAARKVKDKPTIILAHTVKGKGVSFMEGKNTWHGKPISEEEYKKAMVELGGENK